nr:Mfa1 family fimbria major subunit [Prevotella sp.]
MRIKHFFGLAVLAAMTASCSSNNDLVVGGGNGSGENESGVSYASFSINLPTTSGTRADGDLTFEDGNTNEYKVNDATLLIFKKGSTEKEGDYTFVESAELGSMAPWKGSSETGVTTHAKITAKLGNVNKTDNLFALVLLNNGTGTNAKVSLPEDGEKFSTWNAKTTEKFAKPENGFYMANAPLFKDNNVTTLVPIESTKIYPTEEEAAKNAATDVYVERGLAKVTLGTGTTTVKTVADGSTYQGDQVTISNWALDVTNKKAYPIHNVDGLTDKFPKIWSNDDATASPTNNATTRRFVDNTATLARRVYWGIDPNYNNKALCTDDADGTTARKAEFNYVTNTADVKEDPDKPLYCLENTFDLANMKQGQTTRIIFKATYKPKDLPEGETTFYKIGKNTAIWSKDDLEKEIKAAVASVVSGATTENTKVKLDASENDITAAGTHYIEAVNIKVNDTPITDTGGNITAINTQLGLNKDKKVGISTYAGGESYYVARIKHFGDALTKWESGQPYNDDNLSFLGRYGMLRNNWYELTVESVSGPGYPSVPEVKPNTPDDEDDMYIKVSVKILKWAKRSQTVDL